MYKKIIFGLVIVIAVIAGSIWATKQTNAPTNHTDQTPVAKAYLKTNDIEVTEPAIQSMIKSPLTVTGMARGFWFFEASFPVLVTDSAGALVGTGVAQAEGDWMTTELVPFKAEITFTKPVSPTGFIVLKKDNPSGLPENDKQEKFEVTFK